MRVLQRRQVVGDRAADALWRDVRRPDERHFIDARLAVLSGIYMRHNLRELTFSGGTRDKLKNKAMR